jgi:DNA-binding NarL/FixJ family response regulator
MENNNHTEIIIADDHPLFRSGLKHELLKHEFIKVISEACRGEEALTAIENLNPDIAILDIRMPEKSGLEILSILNEKPTVKTKIILLTMHRNKNYLFRAISLGVKGYLLKEDAVAEISKGVDTVIEGEHFISSSLSDVLLPGNKSLKETEESIQAVASLTKMERQVLKLIAEWKTNNEIAEELFISPRTAGNHRSNISIKLNLSGTYGVIKFALENKDLF